MKHAVAVATLVSLFACGPSVRAGDRIATVGNAAPAFDLQSPAGVDYTLASLKGKPAVLNVFASWCPPCREELPRIVSAARRTRGTIGFVGVDAQEPVAMALGFAKKMSLPYPVVIDHGQFQASYGAASLPETVFLDRRGVVRAIYHGPIPQDDLDRDLALITAGGSTSMETRP